MKRNKLVLYGCATFLLIGVMGLILVFTQRPIKAHSAGGSGDWPTYMSDVARTGTNLNETVITNATASNLQLAWKFTTTGIVGASPAIVNGVMYIGSWDGYEYAINISTQQLLWKQYLGISVQSRKCYTKNGVGIDSSATVENNVVYVGGGDGYMYALNASDGSVIWRTLLGNPPYYNWSSPLIYNNELYIGLAAYCDPPFVQGKIQAFNISDGSLAASVSLVPDGQTGAPVWGSPAVDVNTNTIYVATGNNGSKPLAKQPYAESIVALDATTLNVTDHWQIPAAQQIKDSDFGVTPVLFDLNDTHYIGALNKDGIYYVLDRYNLSAGPIWEQVVSARHGLGYGDNVSSACYNNGVVYAGAGGNNIGGQTYGGAVHAFDAATGSVLWADLTTGKMVSPVTCTSDLVIDNQGRSVEVRDAFTGNILFSYATRQRIYGASLISNGVLYTPSTDKSIYAFTLNNQMTPTDTPTATPTDTPTDTPTATPTDSPTDTPTATPTDTPTDTPTATPTDTPTATPTDTPTDTPTATPTDTPTDTPTPTPTQ